MLGVIALREGPKIPVHSTGAVRDTLVQHLGFDTVLGAFSGVDWQPLDTNFAPLPFGDGSASGLQFRSLPLPGGPPRFVPGISASSEGHSIALQLLDEQTGGILLVAPDVSALTSELSVALRDSSAILFDGTFWSDDELRLIHPTARTSREMGHLRIADGSLEALRSSPASTKIYLHINNTNPILAADSSERAAVEAAGIQVGTDGMEFTL